MPRGIFYSQLGVGSVRDKTGAYMHIYVGIKDNKHWFKDDIIYDLMIFKIYRNKLFIMQLIYIRNT